MKKLKTAHGLPTCCCACGGVESYTRRPSHSLCLRVMQALAGCARPAAALRVRASSSRRLCGVIAVLPCATRPPLRRAATPRAARGLAGARRRCVSLPWRPHADTRTHCTAPSLCCAGGARAQEVGRGRAAAARHEGRRGDGQQVGYPAAAHKASDVGAPHLGRAVRRRGQRRVHLDGRERGKVAAVHDYVRAPPHGLHAGTQSLLSAYPCAHPRSRTRPTRR